MNNTDAMFWFLDKINICYSGFGYYAAESALNQVVGLDPKSKGRSRSFSDGSVTHHA